MRNRHLRLLRVECSRQRAALDGAPLTVLLLAMVSSALGAGPVAASRSREPLPAISVERGLVIPRGWSELSVQLAGERGDLGLRYGLAPHVEVFGALPVFVSGRALIGDSLVGARFELLHEEVPAASVAVEVGYSGPSGTADPRGSLHAVGGWLGALGSRQFGALVLGGSLRAMRFVGLDGTQGAVRGWATLQGGPLVLRAEGLVVSWERAVDRRALAGVELHVSRGVEVGFVADIGLVSEGALAPSQGGGPTRLGGLVRLHL